MYPRSPITRISTPEETSTWPAGSFCLYYYWQMVRCLWSLHVSGIPCHTALHPSRNVYLTSWFILSVLFLTGSETSVVPTCVRVPNHTDLHPLCVSGIPSHTDLHPGRNVYLTSWFIFLCCFWQVAKCLWSLHVSRIPSHTDLCPSRNVCLTSWFILCVLFLTDGETSVVPRCVQIPAIWTSTQVGTSTWPAVSFCLCCFWQAVRCLWSLHMSTILSHTDHQPSRTVATPTWPAGSFCLCCFWQLMRRLWSLHMSGIPFTQTSTQVGMSTWPAGSFCLCCFWQVVRCLWSLHMSRIPCHMDLHPGRNVYLTSQFILSVFYLTGSETSVVPTCVQDPLSHWPPPR